MGLFRQGYKAMFGRNKWKILRGDKVRRRGKGAGAGLAGLQWQPGPCAWHAPASLPRPLLPAPAAAGNPHAAPPATHPAPAQVMVMAGKDAGQVGTVTKVIRDVRFPRVLVEGLNLVRACLGRASCCCCCSSAAVAGHAACTMLQASFASACCRSCAPAAACYQQRHMRTQHGRLLRRTFACLCLAHAAAGPPAHAQNKRFLKRSKDNPGGIVSVESPLHYSNVSLVDPVTEQPVRVTWRFLEDGTKVGGWVGGWRSGGGGVGWVCCHAG